MKKNYVSPLPSYRGNLIEVRITPSRARGKSGVFVWILLYRYMFEKSDFCAKSQTSANFAERSSVRTYEYTFLSWFYNF
jgi:hypothetical protein